MARTIAKQFSSRAESATAPFQFALSTRAGCECVTHVVRAATDINDRTTIVSVDGIGAYDSISRNSMLEGLHRMVDGDQMIPFVRLFYGSPSVYLWEDDMGDTHEIIQGEGGEQGDPLMPLLFSLGQHSALLAINAKLKEGESCLLSWTICMCCVRLEGSERSTKSFRTSCGAGQTSKCTTGRQKCGTGQE